jgi:hypothetical protein
LTQYEQINKQTSKQNLFSNKTKQNKNTLPLKKLNSCVQTKNTLPIKTKLFPSNQRTLPTKTKLFPSLNLNN